MRQPIQGASPPPSDAGRAPLSDAARRALAEAEARRQEYYEARLAELVRDKEVNGSKGPEPVRYGDWENKGIASDF